MSDIVSDASTLSPSEQEAVERLVQMDKENLVDKIKYMGLHVESMGPQEKGQYTSQFDMLAKSLGKLRRVLRKKMPQDLYHWKFWLCLTLLVVIYG